MSVCVLQYREYVRYGKLVTGIDESQLNVVFAINMRVQIFVKKLIQVQYSALWTVGQENWILHLRLSCACTSQSWNSFRDVEVMYLEYSTVLSRSGMRSAHYTDTTVPMLLLLLQCRCTCGQTHPMHAWQSSSLEPICPVCGVQPQFSPCMTPDAKVLSVLRDHFLLKPQGIPFFTPSLRLRASVGVPEAAQPQNGARQQGGADGSDDWRVVVYLRPWGTARSLANETAVVEELIRLFGDARVVQLRRNLPLQEGTMLYTCSITVSAVMFHFACVLEGRAPVLWLSHLKRIIASA